MKGAELIVKVLKKDGSIQDFDLSRILLTIQLVSDEAKAPLTTSDINYLGQMIEKSVIERGTDIMHIDAIYSIIISTLAKGGFKTVAEYFDNIKRTA